MAPPRFAHDLHPEEFAGEVDNDGKHQYERNILSKRNPGERVDVVAAPVGSKRVNNSILDVIGEIQDGQGMTVTLVRLPFPGDPAPPSPDNGFVHPVAMIEFGQGGARAVVEIDVVHGAQVFIPASSIRVDAFNEPPQGFTVDPPVSPCGIAAFVDFFPPARRSKIYRSKHFKLAPAASAVIQIPPFASSVIVERTPFAASFTVDVLNIFAGILYTDVVAASTRETSLDLGGPAEAIKITAGGVAIEGWAIFELGL